ncbi:MAG: hypothetical protein ACXWLH_02320 [Candidatus Saccharimonadales bacterium]
MSRSIGQNLKRKELAFVALFAVIGVLLLVLVRAAGINLSVEPENGTVNGPATTVGDTTASGGSAVKFNKATSSGCTGPTVTLTGNTSTKYTNASPANGTTFNLSGWLSTAVTGPGHGQGFDVGGTVAPNAVCVKGGVMKGQIDLSLDWRYVHDSIGGFGYRTFGTGLESVDGARIYNVEDGWKPRECPTSADQCSTFANGNAHMFMTNTYMSGMRDDAIEDDDFLPGTIQNSLFDGMYTFLSEQLQGTSGEGVGPSEDQYIRLTNVLVRMYNTDPPTGGSYVWFKWLGSTSHHKLIITDSVFAFTSAPNTNPGSGWSSAKIPTGTQWLGTNYILWLGSGTYGGPKPAGVTYLEGQPAIDKWGAVRNAWLTSHGYDPIPVDDLNPMDDPVVAPR